MEPANSSWERTVRNPKQCWRYYSLCDWYGNWILSVLPNYNPVILRMWKPAYVDVNVGRHDAAMLLWAARKEKRKDGSSCVETVGGARANRR